MALAHVEGDPVMNAQEFRDGLARLGLSQAEAARYWG
jgi:hypothetical protein